MKDCPRLLFQKLLFTSFVGVGCFTVGLVLYIVNKDQITLALSGAVLLLCLIRSIDLYYIVKKKRYDRLEGLCTSISAKPLQKYITVRIADDNGIESTLRLGKQTNLKTGCRYRFFFSCGNDIKLPPVGEYLSTSLSAGQFLGFEEAE